MKYTYFFLVIVFFGSAANAQDPHFTQFYANPLYTNPALAGTGFRDEIAAGRVTANYRNQWNSTFNTFCLGWDQQFDKLHGGVGAQYITESTSNGFIRNSGLLVNYAGRFNVGKKTQVSLGLQGGAMKKRLDFDKLIIGYGYYNLIDSNLLNPTMIPKSSITYPNINMGFLITGKNYFFGISVFNLNRPMISFYQNPNVVLPRRFAIHGGYAFKINQHWQITPQIQGTKQGIWDQLLLGTLVNRKEFFTGAWIRQSFGRYHNVNALAINIGYGLNGFRVMYSNDIGVSNLRHSFLFSHELSLRYCWKTKQTGPKFCNALN